MQKNFFEFFYPHRWQGRKNFGRECFCHRSRPSHLLKRSLTIFIFVASVSRDGTLKLWELNDDGNMRKTLQGTSKWIYSCEWSPDAKMMVTTGDSRSVRFFFVTHSITFQRTFLVCQLFLCPYVPFEFRTFYVCVF